MLKKWCNVNANILCRKNIAGAMYVAALHVNAKETIGDQIQGHFALLHGYALLLVLSVRLCLVDISLGNV